MCQWSSPRRRGFASASATGRLACTSSTEHLRPNAGAVHRHHLGQLLAPVVRLRRRCNGITLKEVFMKDQVRGKAEEIKGKVTGNRTEETKGKARQTVGNLKRTVRDVKGDVR